MAKEATTESAEKASEGTAEPLQDIGEQTGAEASDTSEINSNDSNEESQTTDHAADPGTNLENNSKVEDDEGGWITPDNFGTLEHPLLAGDVEEEVEVACITADYAMQNVLLQMGLQVLSIDGLLIREVRTFVLRCIACFKCALSFTWCSPPLTRFRVTRDMDRLFCPSCGNHSLRKVAYVVDAQGAPVLLLSNRPPSIRGTKVRHY